jgi:endogenous inhibitor of DNA gyrase (YacG/DUF329 family)
MCTGTKTKCSFCGSTIVQSGKGRTKDYCNDNCQNANKFLSAFETKFLKVDEMSADAKKELRSKLWSLANLTNGK